MTVAEAISVLKGAETIYLTWDGLSYPIDPNDTLMMDAYGKYLVKSIGNYFEAGKFEIEIAFQPVKAEGRT